MKPLPSYLSLFAILFQAIFASSSLNGSASLKSKKPGGSNAKKVVGKLVMKLSAFFSTDRDALAMDKPAVDKSVTEETMPSTSKQFQTKNITGKHRQKRRNNAVSMQSESKLLIELLPKELVRIVIDYFDDNFYPLIVSTYSCSFENAFTIAVDSARVYMLINSEGIKGLHHSLANASEDEHRFIELGDPRWFRYWRFNSSHDGRYVSFRHSYKASINRGKQFEEGTKWFTQGRDSEDGRLKPVTFDSENAGHGILSRDGQTLCSSSYRDSTACVYRVREEAGRDPIGFMKFKIIGMTRAVSGKGSRAMVTVSGKLQIHDISKDTSKLVCQIDVNAFWSICALNEDGSEAAFSKDNELRIVKVDEVVGEKADQPAIISAKFPESAGSISKLVYDEEGKLHVLHDGGKVSFFDPLKKKFMLFEVAQEGQQIVRLAISPNAEYMAVLHESGTMSQTFTHEMTVRRKFRKPDWKDLFGYEADKDK